MKQVPVLLIACAVASSIAFAGTVKVTVVTSSGLEDEPTTTFTSDTPKIFGIFKTKGISEGDHVRGVLIAEDVGAAAAPNTKVLEKTLKLDDDTNDGDFTFSKPDQGWPAGKYRFEVYVNDQLAAKTQFTVGGAEKVESEESAESAEVPDEKELASMTQSSLISFGGGVKKKDFSAFYKECATFWQKQTTPEKLRDAFQDFYNKNIDLSAAIKGLDPVFNHPAKVDSDGILLLQGYYPTTPNRIVFKLKYLEEESEWKLVGIDVNLKE